ncbi:hypothetical protein G039_0326010 [Pseudomonas aeruginosa VRFPA01]|nr:hypothetical protein G039_0326010 [Pseudomonas aeruginosa VRFPA01]
MATVLPFDAAGIHLDPAQGLARQLYAALRERILDGRLGSRTRMPASRELAQALKVSRNTVVRAYEQLHAEGYIDGRTGDGTYVAELQEIPGRAAAVAPTASAPRQHRRVLQRDRVRQPAWLVVVGGGVCRQQRRGTGVEALLLSGGAAGTGVDGVLRGDMPS